MGCPVGGFVLEQDWQRLGCLVEQLEGQMQPRSEATLACEQLPSNACHRFLTKEKQVIVSRAANPNLAKRVLLIIKKE